MAQLVNARDAARRLKTCCVPLDGRARKSTLEWASKCCLSIDAWHLFAWIIDRVPRNQQWLTQMATVVVANKMHHSVKGSNKATISKWKWRITPKRLCEEEVELLRHLRWAVPYFIMSDCVKGMANVFPKLHVYENMMKASVAAVKDTPLLSVVDVCCACVRACVHDKDAIAFWDKYERGMRSRV